MICLCTFLEPMTILGIPLSPAHAYRMDDEGTVSDMRLAVGLGTCHVCDYCMEHEGSVVLLEDTRLVESAHDLKKKYPCLNQDSDGKATRRLLRDEQLLKVCGSLLVLWQLAERCEDAKTFLNARNFEFWLVVPDDVSPDETHTFDYFLAELRGAIHDVSNVRILRLKEFRTLLPT